MDKNIRPKTIFCDIDGVIFKHTGNITQQHCIEPELLPGVLDNFKKWDLKGYRIILVSGRRESTRKQTEDQLSKAGIFYDMLILGIGGGTRVIINDRKPNSTEDTAISINVDRNIGLKGID